MRRREFCRLVAGAAGLPLAARAQEPAPPQIGILNSISYGPIADRLGAFLEQLEEGGFVDGRNLEIAYRSAEGQTSSIPIVFAVAGDPLELGLVLNLDHPEGNVTGAGRRTEELNPQRLKVISDMVPQERPLAFLLNSDLAPADTTNERIEDMQAAARAVGRRLVVIDLAGQSELASVFAGMAQQDVAAFVISTEALFSVWRD